MGGLRRFGSLPSSELGTHFMHMCVWPSLLFVPASGPLRRINQCRAVTFHWHMTVQTTICLCEGEHQKQTFGHEMVCFE